MRKRFWEEVAEGRCNTKVQRWAASGTNAICARTNMDLVVFGYSHFRVCRSCVPRHYFRMVSVVEVWVMVTFDQQIQNLKGIDGHYIM